MNKAYVVAWICQGCHKIHTAVFPGVEMERENAAREELVTSCQNDNEPYACFELPFVGTIPADQEQSLPGFLQALLGGMDSLN